MTAAEIEQIVADIAPLVARDIGWPVSADRIKVEVLAPRKFMARVMDEIVRRMGFTKEELAFRDPDWMDRTRNTIAKTGMPQAMTAAWLVADDTVVYSKPRLAGMTLDKLREVTYHEMVHSGQDFNGDVFFNAVASASKRAAEIRVKNANDTGDDYFDAMDRVNALMTLCEGQATFLQGLAKDAYFPKASQGFDVGGTVGGLLTLVSKGGISKLMQYVAGNEVVKKLYDTNPALLDVLFDHPSLAEALFRRRGTVEINLAVDQASPEYVAAGTLVAKLFLVGPVREDGFKILLNAKNGRTGATFKSEGPG